MAISLPGAYTLGAREMYCRNVYLRGGLTMPTEGWVVDLGANCGLFSVWAAASGSQVLAVEAQQGFAPLIKELARHNRVDERVRIEIAIASGVAASGAKVGLLADDRRWSATSHGALTRPPDLSIPKLISKYQIDSIGLLKMDIEGGEFAVLADGDDLDWLRQVDQIALELHRDFGDGASLVDRLQRHGFTVDLQDNNGQRVTAGSEYIDYVYCHR